MTLLGVVTTPLGGIMFGDTRDSIRRFDSTGSTVVDHMDGPGKLIRLPNGFAATSGLREFGDRLGAALASRAET